MNARDKGKVDHGILERFYRQVTADGVELDPALAARVDALVDETYDNLEREMPPFNRTMREIERAATRRILCDFLARDIADLRANGLRPNEFEYQCEATVEGIHVKGWIDRIDAGAGRYRVIDYKGGKATRHKDLGKKIDRGVRLQLPLYAIAVAQHFNAPDVSGAIKPLVFPEVKADKFAFELREKEAAVRGTIELFANAIVDGRFPAFPADTDKDFNACKYCPVSHSCRTRHDLTEKYAIVHYGDARTLLGGAE
jgi:RecB family exonuclease